MSSIETLKKKFYSKPTRKDITMDEVRRLAAYYDCKIHTGGNHQISIFNPRTGYSVPLPQHGKEVNRQYIRELQELFGDEGSKEQ